MAFCELNGWAVPVAEGGASVTQRGLGSIQRAFSGWASGERRALVRDFKLTTPPQDEATANALESLAAGLGESWSFDNDLWGSKGTGPNTGYTVTLSAVGGKYGGKVQVNAGSSLAYAIAPSVYTLLVWRFNGATWDHYGIDSSGAQWKNGAAHTPIGTDDVTNFTTFGASSFSIDGKDAGGVNAASDYDDLVFVPWVMPAAEVSGHYGSGVAFAPLPALNLTGDIIPQSFSVVIGAPSSEALQVVALSGSNLGRTVTMNLRDRSSVG